MEYISLSSNGISGHNMYNDNEHWDDTKNRSKDMSNVHNITGQFGNQFGSSIQTSCGYKMYKNHDNHYNPNPSPYAKN
jgi:hypothetical protein